MEEVGIIFGRITREQPDTGSQRKKSNAESLHPRTERMTVYLGRDSSEANLSGKVNSYVWCL
jgi:hypothetical protein